MDSNAVQHGIFYYNWGNIASVVGLAITIGTFFTARSAKKAANQARDAAENRLLVDEIRRCEGLIRDLASHSKARRYSEAELRSSDLADLLRWILEYWNEELKVNVSWGGTLLSAKTDTEELSTLFHRFNLSQSLPIVREQEKARRIADSIFAGIVQVRAGLEKRRSKNG